MRPRALVVAILLSTSGITTAYGDAKPVTESDFAAAVQGCWENKGGRVDRICFDGGVSGEVRYWTESETLYVWLPGGDHVGVKAGDGLAGRYEFRDDLVWLEFAAQKSSQRCDLLLDRGMRFKLFDCVPLPEGSDGDTFSGWVFFRE